MSKSLFEIVCKIAKSLSGMIQYLIIQLVYLLMRNLKKALSHVMNVLVHFLRHLQCGYFMMLTMKKQPFF